MLLLLDDLFSDDSQETRNVVPCVGMHTWEAESLHTACAPRLTGPPGYVYGF